MSKTKHDFIIDFLFEVNGQFHQPDFDLLSSFYDLQQKEYEEKLQKAISALKIEIDYPECTLINSRGDTFTFNNNSINEGLIDFLSFHEEGLKSFL